MSQLNITSNDRNFFNNQLWRNTLNEFCNIISSKHGRKYEAICPWGFEVFNDNNFLSKNIRRYFCYFGVNDESLSDDDLNQLSEQIIFELFEYIKHNHPSWSDQVVCLLSNEQVYKLKEDGYSCQQSDKLLSVTLKKTNDILDSYAKYIICSLSSLNDNIGESREYQTNMVFRWRTYQLYLIVEHIFSRYTSELSRFENRLVRVATTFTDNAIQPFFGVEENCHPIEEIERSLFDSFIFKRTKMIANAIKSDNENIVITQCFHTTDTLSLDIDVDIYKETVNLIKDTYNSFVV